MRCSASSELAAALALRLGPQRPLRLTLDSRARRMRLCWRDGHVALRAPPWVDGDAVLAFVEANLGWIDRQRGLAEQRTLALRHCFRLDPHDGQLPLWGQPHRIECSTPLAAPQGGPPGAPADSSGAPAGVLRLSLDAERADALPRLRRLLLRELQARLHAHVLGTLPELQARGARAPRSLRIRALRSLWGSMSSRGALSLNLGLVFLPSALCDYVLAHELAHIEEHNHGPRFWAIVERLYPQWRPARRELRQQHELVQQLLAALCRPS